MDELFNPDFQIQPSYRPLFSTKIDPTDLWSTDLNADHSTSSIQPQSTRSLVSFLHLALPRPRYCNSRLLLLAPKRSLAHRTNNFRYTPLAPLKQPTPFLHHNTVTYVIKEYRLLRHTYIRRHSVWLLLLLPQIRRRHAHNSI